MVRHRRRSKRTFSFKRFFFKDYPVIVIIAIVFVLGVWAGFGLGRKSLEWKGVGEKAVRIAPVAQIAIPKPLPKRVEGVKMVPEKRISPPVPRPVERAPRIAFVVDDIGYNRYHEELLFSIDRPITLAILPQLAYSGYFAKEGKKRGFETILHLPLEPDNEDDDPGPGVIKVDMDPGEVKDVLRKNLATVPGVVGVSNHMGSRATKDLSLMYLIARELGNRDLFFLDSLTHSRSAGFAMARLAGTPAVKRDVFLDNHDDFEYITKQIEEVAQVAKRSKRAVAIGHIRENTLRAIKEAIPRLEAQGIRLSTLKDLL